MERYTGQAMPSGPRIALIANDALGNFAICTPLAQALRHFNPGCRIDFYGGERTKEIERASELFEWRCSMQGVPVGEAARAALRRRIEVGGYDLTMNVEGGLHIARTLAGMLGQSGYVCGPCLSMGTNPEVPDDLLANTELFPELEFPPDDRGDLWRDREWASPTVTSRYPFLTTGFIGEMFIRLAYLPPIEGAAWPGGIPRYLFPTEEPSFEIPPVLISTGASLPEKLWPVHKWREVLQWLRAQGHEVGLVGAPPKRQQEFYHSDADEQSLVDEGLAIDLRGNLTLPQVVGALAEAHLVVTLDNGILHFAAANDVPTVGLYRPMIANLWAPPNPNLRIIEAKHGTVATIEVDDVISVCAFQEAEGLKTED